MIKNHEHKFLMNNNGSVVCFDCDLSYSKDELLTIAAQYANAAEQSVQADGAKCACKLPGFDVGNVAICPTCHKPHRS